MHPEPVRVATGTPDTFVQRSPEDAYGCFSLDPDEPVIAFIASSSGFSYGAIALILPDGADDASLVLDDGTVVPNAIDRTAGPHPMFLGFLEHPPLDEGAQVLLQGEDGSERRCDVEYLDADFLVNPIPDGFRCD